MISVGVLERSDTMGRKKGEWGKLKFGGIYSVSIEM